MQDISSQINSLLSSVPNYADSLKSINEPINSVRWIPIELVEANDYNPNSVATTEMQLLYISVLKDGYTQPVVTIFDPNKGKFIIIDGFHRYSIMKHYKDIYERCRGLLPCVVLEKSLSDRMAATIRHNRARGKHSINGMSNIVFGMLDQGLSDSDICNELGMEVEELLRLKHVTGFSKLFKDSNYKKAWESRQQVQLRINAERQGMRVVK